MGAWASRIFPPSPEAFRFYEALVPGSLGALILGGIAVVVLGPLAEEIIFRGLVLGALARLVPVSAAIGLSAVLFAASHGSPWMLGPISLLGVVLGVLVWRTRKLTAAWAGHGLFNLVAYVDLCVTHDPRATRLESWSLEPWVLWLSLASLAVAGWLVLRSPPESPSGAQPEDPAVEE
jgi:membrane protease YdiL (CAAX protease family)